MTWCIISIVTGAASLFFLSWARAVTLENNDIRQRWCESERSLRDARREIDHLKHEADMRSKGYHNGTVEHMPTWWRDRN